MGWVRVEPAVDRGPRAPRRLPVAYLTANPNNPRALLGAARRLQGDGHAGGDSLLRAALNLNPEYVEARTLHGELLLHLEDFGGPQPAIDRPLNAHPSAQPPPAGAAPSRG